jgi:hypothetical protein
MPRLRRGAGGQKFIFPTPLFLFARLLETGKRFFERRRGLNLGGGWF